MLDKQSTNRTASIFSEGWRLPGWGLKACKDIPYWVPIPPMRPSWWRLSLCLSAWHIQAREFLPHQSPERASWPTLLLTACAAPEHLGIFFLCQLFKCQTAQDSSSCAYIFPCPLHTPGQTFWCPLNDQQRHRDTSSPQLNSSTTCRSTHQRFTSPPPSVTQPVTQSRTLRGTLTPPCIWQQPKSDWFCSPGLPAADVFRPPTRSSNCFPSPSSFQ